MAKKGIIVRDQDAIEAILSYINFCIKMPEEFDRVSLAIIAHYAIIMVHPFADSNHRTGQLLQDFILIESGYPPISLFVDTTPDKYREKLDDVRCTRGRDIRPVIRYLSTSLMNTLKEINSASEEKDPRQIISSGSGSESSKVSESSKEINSASEENYPRQIRSGSESPTEPENKKPRVFSSCTSSSSCYTEPETARGEDNDTFNRQLTPIFFDASLLEDSVFNPAISVHLPSRNDDLFPSSSELNDGHSSKSSLQEDNKVSKFGLGCLFKEALREFNPQLLLYDNSYPPSPPAVVDPSVPSKAGLSLLFKAALGEFNPELLKYD